MLLMMLTVGLSLVNALCVVKLKMPAFIVTIAMLYVCKGGARALTFCQTDQHSGCAGRPAG